MDCGRANRKLFLEPPSEEAVARIMYGMPTIQAQADKPAMGPKTSQRKTLLFANHVRKVLFVVADVFNQLLVRK